MTGKSICKFVLNVSGVRFHESPWSFVAAANNLHLMRLLYC